MRKYTIVDYFGYNLTPCERMRCIREAGFDGVILLWADYFDPDYRDFPKYAAREGLFVENTHAPYQYANDVWKDSPAGETYTEHILSCIRDCHTYGIPTLVLHPINGSTPLPENPEPGLERFRRMADLAEKLSVNLAVENQGNPAYVDLVLGKVESDRLFFCWDSGHENYFSPERDLIADYGKRLKALHLHDNNGTDDAHALPFTYAPEDGGVNWNRIHDRLVSYEGAVALETLNRGYEYITDPVEFLRLALERAKKIL